MIDDMRLAARNINKIFDTGSKIIYKRNNYKLFYAFINRTSIGPSRAVAIVNGTPNPMSKSDKRKKVFTIE